nr:unnamed protein product [Digitaria exilis]
MWAVVKPKPTLKANSGGHEGRDGLLWWHDPARCQDGDLSISVMQANFVLEDQCLVESGLPLGTVVGVFDGHGGPEVARFIRDNLLSNLRGDAIREAFLATEQGFITLVSRQWETRPRLATVGSCCLVGVVHQGTLLVANVGDSRAVLGKVYRPNGEVFPVQLSQEHSASLEEARKELIAEHPDDPDIVVLKHNIWRVKGLIQEGSARRLIKAALHEAARKHDMLYSDFKRIDRGVLRHFHDDITVVVLFFNHAVPPPLSIRCPLDNGS